MSTKLQNIIQHKPLTDKWLTKLNKNNEYVIREASFTEDVKSHIDYYIDDVPVQIKLDNRICNTGNFFLQYTSDAEGCERDTGKISHCKADYFLYFDTVNSICYILDTVKLRDVLAYLIKTNARRVAVNPALNDGREYFGFIINKDHPEMLKAISKIEVL